MENSDLMKSSAAKKQSDISKPLPTIAIVVLGRERPGFDQEWGSTMLSASIKLLDRISHYTYVKKVMRTPQDVFALFQMKDIQEVDVVVFLQPTIADGRLADAIIQSNCGIPMVFWATPERPNTNEISSNSLVGTHLFVSILRRSGHKTQMLQVDPNESESTNIVQNALLIAYAHAKISTARVGLLGNHAPGFTNLHVDYSSLSTKIGATVEHISFEHFKELVKSFDTNSLKDEIDLISQYHIAYRDIEDSQKMLELQARFMKSYHTIIADRRLTGLAVRCWPEVPMIYSAWPYIAISVMQTHNIPIAIEGDVEGALDMMISVALGYHNCYISDWLSNNNHTIQLWHGGAIPLQFCGLVNNRCDHGAFTNHFNNGLPGTVESNIQPDIPITIYRHWFCDNTYYCSALEGYTIAPLHQLKGTLCVARIDSVDVHDWLDTMLEHGMPHHVSVSIGHCRKKIQKLSYLLSWDWIDYR